MNAASEEYLRSIALTREMTLKQAQITQDVLASIIATLKDEGHPDALVLEGMESCIVRTFVDLADAEYSSRRRGLALGIMQCLRDRSAEEVEQLVDSLILEATFSPS